MSDMNKDMPEYEIIEEAAGEETSVHAEEAAGTENAEQAAQEMEEESGSEDKKGIFGKKKEKKDKKDTQIEELTDRLKRSMAEFDNFRKRTEKEKSQMYEIGAKSIVEKILPIVDNFERGLATVPEEEKENPFVDGMDKIYKQLMSALEEIGVKPIEAVGCPFDPNLHNAVMHIEDEDFGKYSGRGVSKRIPLQRDGGPPQYGKSSQLENGKNIGNSLAANIVAAYHSIKNRTS